MLKSLKEVESTERNPLLLAVEQGNIELAQKYLNEEGVNVNYVIEKVMIDNYNDNDRLLLSKHLLLFHYLNLFRNHSSYPI